MAVSAEFRDFLIGMREEQDELCAWAREAWEAGRRSAAKKGSKERK